MLTRRKRFKTILSVVLSITFALSPALYVSGSTGAPDEPSDWALDEVLKAREYGLIPNNLYFSFTANITRLEFCQLIMALYTKITTEPEKMNLPPAFSDTNNISVLNAYELGIVRGVGDGYFNPGAAITRQEMAVMIFNAINAISVATGQDILYRSSTALTFADSALAADWAVEAIRNLRNNEIMLGDNLNRFNPLDNTTKEMAFILINRIYLIYSGLDARKSFPPAYTGEILMRIKGTLIHANDYQIIGDIYETYPAVDTDELDRYIRGEALYDSNKLAYYLDRSESLSESVASGYTGGAAAGGQYYPVYVLMREGAPHNRLYIAYDGEQYFIYMDAGWTEPFLQRTFTDVLFTVPGGATVYPGGPETLPSLEPVTPASTGGRPLTGPRLYIEPATFAELYRDNPELLDMYVWLVQLSMGRVTRLTAMNKF